MGTTDGRERRRGRMFRGRGGFRGSPALCLSDGSIPITYPDRISVGGLSAAATLVNGADGMAFEVIILKIIVE